MPHPAQTLPVAAGAVIAPSRLVYAAIAIEVDEGFLGRVIASNGRVLILSASVPVIRASPEQLATALREVAAGSLDISRRLGAGEEDQRLRALTTATTETVAARLKRDDDEREEVRPRSA